MSDFHHDTHFVGTYPAANASDAMQKMLSTTRGSLRTVSDGETGERKDWVVAQIESYRSNPAFTLVQDGHWSGYEDCPVFDKTRELTAADLGLKYYEHAKDAWPVLEELRQTYPGVRLQVGVPHALDMALFTFGLANGLKPEYLNPFIDATMEQIEKIHNSDFGKEVVYQIETPASLSMALFPQDALPPQLHPKALGKSLADLAARAPEGARFGVHLCLGDLNNESRDHLKSREAAVALINELTAQWPEGRTLDYVHEPVAAGKHVPSTDPADYQALHTMVLPEGTRYIAGFVHEDQPLEDQVKVRDIILNALDKTQRFGISAACGLGRRSPETAELIAERMAALAE